eukprot:3815-Pelagococcus_subviridis.AAC.3
MNNDRGERLTVKARRKDPSATPSHSLSTAPLPPRAESFRPELRLQRVQPLRVRRAVVVVPLVDVPQRLGYPIQVDLALEDAPAVAAAAAVALRAVAAGARLDGGASRALPRFLGLFRASARARGAKSYDDAPPPPPPDAVAADATEPSAPAYASPSPSPSPPSSSSS